jgi:hypothetical protein
MFLVPHVMLGSEGKVVDFSLDPLNSPPISHPSYSPFRMFFGFMGSGNKVNFFGDKDVYPAGVNNVMVSNDFGNAASAQTASSIHHVYGTYTWIGNRVWVVGGTDGLIELIFFSFSTFIL